MVFLGVFFQVFLENFRICGIYRKREQNVGLGFHGNDERGRAFSGKSLTPTHGIYEGSGNHLFSEPISCYNTGDVFLKEMA